MPTLNPNTNIWVNHRGIQKKGLQGYLYTPLWSAIKKTRCTKLYTKCRGRHVIMISLLVEASCLLFEPHPKPCVARLHLVARQRTTRSLGSRRQSQCAWKILEGASRSCSSSLPLGLGGWYRAAAPCCTRGVHPCAAPGLFDSHRGTAIFESWYNNTRLVMAHMVKYAEVGHNFTGIRYLTINIGSHQTGRWLEQAIV